VARMTSAKIIYSVGLHENAGTRVLACIRVVIRRARAQEQMLSGERPSAVVAQAN
jgi:hypothetical protein